MNKTGIVHRKVAESAKGNLIFLSVERTERKKYRFQGIKTGFPLHLRGELLQYF